MNSTTAPQPIPNDTLATVLDESCGWKIGTVGRVYDWAAFADGSAQCLFFPLVGGASRVDATCLEARNA